MNKLNSVVIFIGSDHAGWEAKKSLIEYLNTNFKIHKIIDCGCKNLDSCDYPDIAKLLTSQVLDQNYKCFEKIGILICGTGIGMTIAANKVNNIRCGLATNKEMAKMAKEHNNCQVLALGSRISTQSEINEISKTFIISEFDKSNPRHQRRINKIDNQ